MMCTSASGAHAAVVTISVAAAAAAAAGLMCEYGLTSLTRRRAVGMIRYVHSMPQDLVDYSIPLPQVSRSAEFY